MKILFCYVSIYIFLAGAVNGSPLEITNDFNCLNPQSDDCSFYTECVESKFKCGSAGYPLAYGDKYCRAFLNAQNISVTGRSWITSTMLCLQNRLVPFMSDNYQSNAHACDLLSKWAFDSHSYCYTQHENSFCYLGPIDLIRITSIVGFRDLFGSRIARRQVREVLKACYRKLSGKKNNRLQRDAQIKLLTEALQLYAPDGTLP